MIGVPQPAQQVSRPIRPTSNRSDAPIATKSISSMVDDNNILNFPNEILDFFSINKDKLESFDKNQIEEIYNLLKVDTLDVGDVLLKIQEIERKIGSPKFNESRYGRIWSYIKINNKINDMEKQKRAMEIAGGQ